MGRRRTESVLHHAKEELYDLEKDPLEITNIAGDPSAAPVLSELREKVRKMRRETKDPWFIEDQGLG